MIVFGAIISDATRQYELMFYQKYNMFPLKLGCLDYSIQIKMYLYENKTSINQSISYSVSRSDI